MALDTSAGDVKVLAIALDAYKFAACIDGGEGSGARTHEGVEDAGHGLGNLVDAPVHEAQGLLGGMLFFNLTRMRLGRKFDYSGIAIKAAPRLLALRE